MGYQHWFCSTYDQGLWELRRRHGFTELGVGLQIVMQDMAVPMLPFQKEGRKARFWRSWLAWETTLDMELIVNTRTASFYPWFIVSFSINMTLLGTPLVSPLDELVRDLWQVWLGCVSRRRVVWGVAFWRMRWAWERPSRLVAQRMTGNREHDSCWCHITKPPKEY